ncbi:MAG TPA: hypothetical protein VFW00_13425 [Rhodocyclaceae bacterium]|nr:hypothetical protein [Rhodocyclaceae bacterium]
MFKSFSKNSTHRLTESVYALRVRPRRPAIWLVAGVAFIACGTAVALRLNSVSPEQYLRNQMERLVADNQHMQQALEQSTFKVQQETAIRTELERQMSDMSAQLKHLQDELTFFRSRKDKAAAKSGE